MKSTKKLLLVLASAFLLASCGNENSGNNNGNNNNNNNNQPAKEVEVLDEGNTKVTFKEIENLIGINEKAQKYIDKMKQQEKYAEHPYRFNALDGHDDIEVKNELSQSDNKANRPIHIEWEKGDMNYEKINVLVCKDWKFNTYETYEVTGNSIDLDNLYRDQTYYYRLENADKSIQSQVQKFTTGDYTRTINMKGASGLAGDIYNMRDEGGYMTSFGVKTNQGLIYRGSEINKTSFSYSGNHNINVDDVVLEKNAKVTKIGLEIDLRKEDAIDSTNKAGKSGLDSEAFPVEYMRIPYRSYADFVTDPDGLQEHAIRDVFNKFAEADDKVVYFHCWGGADRTGALGFFLNGLLGVSLTDLYIDFELTTQNNSLRSHKTPEQSYNFPNFLKAIKEDKNYAEDKTIADFCYDWLVEHGVEADTLETIREIMIPGYTPGMAQEVND